MLLCVLSKGNIHGGIRFRQVFESQPEFQVEVDLRTKFVGSKINQLSFRVL